jgi:hypothetical protein
MRAHCSAVGDAGSLSAAWNLGFSCRGHLRELRGRRADRDGQSRACAAETNAATQQC